MCESMKVGRETLFDHNLAKHIFLTLYIYLLLSGHDCNVWTAPLARIKIGATIQSGTYILQQLVVQGVLS